MEKVRSEETASVALDLPPEYCYYWDEGCELAYSCLRCPLARCIYDEPWGKQRWLKRKRSREVAKLFAGGKKTKELAQIFGVSRRTVQRDLKEMTKDENDACF